MFSESDVECKLNETYELARSAFHSTRGSSFFFLHEDDRICQLKWIRQWRSVRARKRDVEIETSHESCLHDKHIFFEEIESSEAFALLWRIKVLNGIERNSSRKFLANLFDVFVYENFKNTKRRLLISLLDVLCCSIHRFLMRKACEKPETLYWVSIDWKLLKRFTLH